MAQTMKAVQRTAYENRRAAEFDRLCDVLRERLLGGSMPPDDAYWWTRIAIQEAAGAKVSGTVVPVTTM
jgi:hypothetical protein